MRREQTMTTGDKIDPKKMMYADESDLEVAVRVRMLFRDQLDHEAVCTGARDRIMYLSQRIEALEDAIDDLVNDSEHDELDRWIVSEAKLAGLDELRWRLSREKSTHSGRRKDISEVAAERLGIDLAEFREATTDSSQYAPYPKDQPLAGPDMPPMKTILDMIRYCTTVHSRFGNTCIHIGGFKWGANALNARDNSRQLPNFCSGCGKPFTACSQSDPQCVQTQLAAAVDS